MGQTRKQRMRKKFDYGQNRKREWKKSKKLPRINNPDIQNAWKDGKSIESNLRSMGLVADPNKMFKLRNDVVEEGVLRKGADGNMEVDTTKAFHPVNWHVVDALETQAKVSRKKNIVMARPVAEVIGYMIATHGDPTDPAVLSSKKTEKSILFAMARDKRNFDQHTPKQLKRKIIAFKRVPEYVEEFLNSRMQ